MRARGKRGSVALSGLTPLVDTLFILLFALLALSETRTSNRAELVRIELPSVEPGAEAAPAPDRQLAIEIDADSRVHLLDPPLELSTREDLDRALTARLGDDLPEEVVLEIRGDRAARHGVAVELLQHLRLRGFTNVHLIASGVSDGEGPFEGGGGGR